MTSKQALSPDAEDAAAAEREEEREEEELFHGKLLPLLLLLPPHQPPPAPADVTATEPVAAATILFSAFAAATKCSLPRGQHASMPWHAAGCSAATTAR